MLDEAVPALLEGLQLGVDGVHGGWVVVEQLHELLAAVVELVEARHLPVHVVLDRLHGKEGLGVREGSFTTIHMQKNRKWIPRSPPTPDFPTVEHPYPHRARNYPLNTMPMHVHIGSNKAALKIII